VKKFVREWSFYIFAWMYTFFIGIFAFDVKVFSLEFLVHQIPFFVLVIINIILLKNPKIGGILYIILFFIFTIFFKTYRDLVVFLLISLPLLILGLVFLKKKAGSKI
jgi:hypothetical protein